MTDRSDPSGETPQLLGLQPLRVAGLGVLAAAAIVVALEFSPWSPFAPAGAFAVTAPTRLFQPVDPADAQALGAAMSRLRVQPLELDMIKNAVRNGTMQLASVSVWDWADLDGDVVVVTSGGFAQTVVLGRHPTTVVIPYVGQSEALITAIRDGEGGVTVAISGGKVQTNLRPLAVGQSISVPVP